MTEMYCAARIESDDSPFLTRVREMATYNLLKQGCALDSIQHKEPVWQDAYTTDDGVEIEAGWAVVSTGVKY